MRTKYLIDDFQQTYFVIKSFEKLLDDCYRDFAPIYKRIGTATDIAAHEVLVGDDVVTRGTLAYLEEMLLARHYAAMSECGTCRPGHRCPEARFSPYQSTRLRRSDPVCQSEEGVRRREFLGVLSGAAAAWPVVARAEDSAVVIGYLSSRSEQSDAPFVAGFPPQPH